jgi:Vitamin K-dependent gamma-carboxylase
MSPLRAVTTRWNALWFAPASPYPLAAFRILLGAYLVAYFATMLPHVTVLFSSHGVRAPWLVPDYAPPPLLAWSLYLLLCGAAFALLLGWRMAVTAPVLLGLYLHHYFLALAVKHSAFERLIVVYLLALWLGGSDRVWACSSRPAHPELKPTVPSFGARLLRFQTIVLYLGAGLWKAANAGWQSGVVLASTLQSMWATPLAFWWVRQGITPEGWATLSRLVIGGEILLAVLLWIPRTRYVGIALGVLFHVGNSVILSIPEFLVCIAPYVVFMPEAHVERIGARLRRLWLRTRSRAGA